jgi:hypothetical protein
MPYTMAPPHIPISKNPRANKNAIRISPCLQCSGRAKFTYPVTSTPPRVLGVWQLTGRIIRDSETFVKQNRVTRCKNHGNRGVVGRGEQGGYLGFLKFNSKSKRDPCLSVWHRTCCASNRAATRNTLCHQQFQFQSWGLWGGVAPHACQPARSVHDDVNKGLIVNMRLFQNNDLEQCDDRTRLIAPTRPVVSI